MQPPFMRLYVQSDNYGPDSSEVLILDRIEIDWQGPPAEGIMNMRWKATGHANADGADGSNIEISLVRPQEP